MVKPAVECAGCDPSNSVCLLFNNKIALSLACCFIERTKTSVLVQGSLDTCLLLRHVWCCWLKFENGPNFYATFVDFAWCYSRLARFVRFAAGWPNARNCCAEQCCDMARSNVAIVWPGLANAGRKMLRICWVEMLQSFDRGFIVQLIWTY